LFIGELGIIPDGGIEDGYEMFLDFVKRVVADHVEPFEVVGEEDLEVVVVGLVQSGIDVVVVRAGIARILHLEVLHKDKVFYHLHVLYLPVFPEEGPD
jgi:DhnA family fructose-bisphosphate aldolase class Ia